MVRNYAIDKFGGLEMDFLQDKHAKLLVMSQTMKGESCMPDITGYEVAKQIRLKPWGEHITLIALTGWGQDDDKRRAQAAGFDHHCTKPVDPDDFERFLEPKNTTAITPQTKPIESVQSEATTDT